MAGKIEGEGSYEGTRQYNERTKRFLNARGEEVEQLAEAARDALEGEERDDLLEAEKLGKAHSKGEDGQPL
jgi:hypothetical protein